MYKGCIFSRVLNLIIFLVDIICVAFTVSERDGTAEIKQFSNVNNNKFVSSFFIIIFGLLH